MAANARNDAHVGTVTTTTPADDVSMSVIATNARDASAALAVVLGAVKTLTDLGFRTIATSGTQRFLVEQGVAADRILKASEGRPNIVDAIRNGEIQLVFNTTEGVQALADSRSLRRAALLHKVPYYTTLSGAVAAAQGIKAYLGGDLEVRTLQSYFGTRTDDRSSKSD